METLKRCPVCKITKPLTEWGKDKYRKDGHASKCKACDREQHAKYYREGGGRELHAARYQQNREEVLARNKANREAIPASAHAAYKRDLRRKHRLAAERIYGGCCNRCGATGDLQFDHVNGGGNAHRAVEHSVDMLRRIARGGERLVDVELQLLCNDCHGEKTRAEWANGFHCAGCRCRDEA